MTQLQQQVVLNLVPLERNWARPYAFTQRSNAVNLVLGEDVTFEPRMRRVLSFGLSATCVDHDGVSVPFRLAARPELLDTPIVPVPSTWDPRINTPDWRIRVTCSNSGVQPFTLSKGASLFRIERLDCGPISECRVHPPINFFEN
ncbi:MAG: hypothetical protein WC700_07670 [Gemmatimonadaceae bacterium]|jgi:hypothetical protein